MSEFYVAVLAANKEGEIFATIPDLPGVNAAASTVREALSLAIDFANDYVRDLIEDGHPVPPARDIASIPVEPEDRELARALIPVEMPGKSVKISLSIDEALLKRADRAAEAEGTTRSGYFADAVGARLRAAAAAPAASQTARSAALAEEGVPFEPNIVRQGRSDQDHIMPLVLTTDANGNLVAGVRVEKLPKKKPGSKS